MPSPQLEVRSPIGCNSSVIKSLRPSKTSSSRATTIRSVIKTSSKTIPVSRKKSEIEVQPSTKARMLKAKVRGKVQVKL